ncbi:sigma factor-like helix-turn-helix DNA-binding protein [Amorphoplanes digitatis]|uniref:DNA-directed RNA polymerase specialized sigma24 family protein n=1 Tax=Actinoplanes digitatis TaxID=1868 RepID=A0A7W7I3T3_9ACTN|nr:sigma factor-like helix-turn-helix DNA-binding protein [Actinoplanes digitatis]MBB4765708.1 DNA-directed RNA polymerase specialized sigma24 family protein [Actinoplanes digitatis]GID98045.1 RNA polymerase sigma24 factor [Actinoplanes digitatis]
MSDGYVTQRYVHLRRTAFLMCGDWARADDLARTTLARFLNEPDAGDPDLWVYADLMGGVKKPRGRRKRVFVAPADSEAGGDAHTVLVLDALHSLAPRCRAVLVLRHFCGLAIDETAGALDLDDGRVLALEAEGLGAFASLLATAHPAGAQ